MMAVRRSHLEDVGARERECHRAVFMRKGVLGSRSFRRAEGEASMVVGCAPRSDPFSFCDAGPDTDRGNLSTRFTQYGQVFRCKSRLTVREKRKGDLKQGLSVDVERLAAIARGMCLGIFCDKL